MKNRNIVVKNILKGSIADEAGIEVGDILLAINGNEIEDIIEYKFLICDENIDLKVKKQNGEEWDIEIEKELYDDIGIEFDDPSMKSPKRCHNKCIFCFIDQLPQGMRGSLYIKDDDSRLSFLQGNFITLTNMSDDDINRIIKYNISPINVSVHTTNPELRIRMLNNKKAGNIKERLKKLAGGGININCQIVLCPGINDGDELKKTLNDLYEFYPKISNVAIVPVGITKYRKNLFEMKGYDRELSKQLIDFIESLQKEFENKTGEPFARLADEFYLIAEEDFPPYDHYGDFAQLEDGIGMARYFEYSVETALRYSKLDGKGKKFALITGTMIYNFMKQISSRIEKKLNIKLSVYPVENDFFGKTINVTGLLTGRDIISQLRGVIREDTAFIPKNVLKADEDVLLDDIRVDDIERELDIKLIKCEYTGEDFIEKVENEVRKCQSL